MLSTFLSPTCTGSCGQGQTHCGNAHTVDSVRRNGSNQGRSQDFVLGSGSDFEKHHIKGGTKYIPRLAAEKEFKYMYFFFLKFGVGGRSGLSPAGSAAGVGSDERS